MERPQPSQPPQQPPLPPPNPNFSATTIGLAMLGEIGARWAAWDAARTQAQRSAAASKQRR